MGLKFSGLKQRSPAGGRWAVGTTHQIVKINHREGIIVEGERDWVKLTARQHPHSLTSARFAVALAEEALGPASKDRGGQAAARREFAANDAPFGSDGVQDVTENLIHGIFIKNAQIAVSEQIHFQGLQFDALFLRHVLDGDGAEVGETGLWAYRGILGEARGNHVARILIWPSFELGQFGVDTSTGMLGSVIGHDCSWHHSTARRPAHPLPETPGIAYDKRTLRVM